MDKQPFNQEPTLLRKGMMSVAALAFVFSACNGGEPDPPPTTDRQPTISDMIQQAEESTKNTCLRFGLSDCDFDGIQNSIDRNPYRADSMDPDGDLALNFEDPNPYSFDPSLYLSKMPAGSLGASGNSGNVPVPGNTESNPILPPRLFTSSLTADEDKDLVPDYLDAFNGDDYGDADGDGLANNRDAAPYNSDRDRDGSPDGYDQNPRDPNVGKRADQRQQEQLLNQRREADRLEAERLRRKQEETRQERQRLEEQRQRAS